MRSLRGKFRGDVQQRLSSRELVELYRAALSSREFKKRSGYDVVFQQAIRDAIRFENIVVGPPGPESPR